MQFAENVSLDALNSLGMSARARWFCDVSSLEDIQEAIAFASMHKLSLLPLGGGTNMVFMGDVDGLVVRNCLPGIDIQEGEVTAGAGENWHGMVTQLVESGLYGLENLALIPGSVGAAPIQNIGAYGVELSDHFSHLTAVDVRTGEECTFGSEECAFGYRDSRFKQQPDYFITAVTLSLTRDDHPVVTYPGIVAWLQAQKLDVSCRNVFSAVTAIRREKLPDPSSEPNVGSFFKNPVVDGDTADRLSSRFNDLPVFARADGQVKLSAAWLIDQAGLKGSTSGAFEVSQRHALVIVNRGGGTPGELRALVDLIQDTVRRDFGVALELEPGLYPAA